MIYKIVSGIISCLLNKKKINNDYKKIMEESDWKVEINDKEIDVRKYPVCIVQVDLSIDLVTINPWPFRAVLAIGKLDETIENGIVYPDIGFIEIRYHKDGKIGSVNAFSPDAFIKLNPTENSTAPTRSVGKPMHGRKEGNGLRKGFD